MLNINQVYLSQVFPIVEESLRSLACVVVAHIVLSDCAPVLVPAQLPVLVVDLKGCLYLLDRGVSLDLMLVLIVKGLAVKLDRSNMLRRSYLREAAQVHRGKCISHIFVQIAFPSDAICRRLQGLLGLRFCNPSCLNIGQLLVDR